MKDNNPIYIPSSVDRFKLNQFAEHLIDHHDDILTAMREMADRIEALEAVVVDLSQGSKISLLSSPNPKVRQVAEQLFKSEVS